MPPPHETSPVRDEPPRDPQEVTTFHVRRAVGGDAESLGWLVERLTPLLLAQARWRLGPTLRRFYDPEDLVNDAWVRTLPRLADLPARDGRYTPVLLRFLATTLVNRINNLVTKHLRRGRGEASGGGGEGGDEDGVLDRLPAEVTGAVTAAARRESASLVTAAIEELDPRDREIILLRGVEQRETETVARLLGITSEAAGMRYLRALRRLRERLPGSVFEEIEDA